VSCWSQWKPILMNRIMGYYVYILHLSTYKSNWSICHALANMIFQKSLQWGSLWQLINTMLGCLRWLLRFLSLKWVKRAHPQDSIIFWFLDTAWVYPCQGDNISKTSVKLSYILGNVVNLHVQQSTSLNPMPNPHEEMFHEIPIHADS